MHPLLLFTLFFISGNFPTSLSTSVIRDLEYSFQTKNPEETDHLRVGIGHDEQIKPKIQVKHKGNVRSVYIPLDSGSNKGFIKYYSSYKEQSQKYPDNDESINQNSITPTFNNGYSVSKQKANHYNKVAFIKNPNKLKINKNNPYFYSKTIIGTEPLKKVQNIEKSIKKELATVSEPLQKEFIEGDDSKPAIAYKIKKNVDSVDFFSDNTFDIAIEDLRNDKSKTLKYNKDIETVDDMKSTLSQDKSRNDGLESHENIDVEELNKSKKSEINLKHNLKNVLRKPRTDNDDESILNNCEIEDGNENFNDKSTLATTAPTITPLQIPRTETESVTEQSIPLHTTTAPYIDHSKDSHDTPSQKPEDNSFSGFITKLIEPLMNNLRNML